MISRYALALLVLIAATATGLFQLKYSVVALKNEVARLGADIEAERWRMRTLEADWAYLARPEHLVAHAEALGMHHASAARIVEIEQIGRRRHLELARRPVPIPLPSGGEALFRVKPVATFDPGIGEMRR